ncbi:hypothetical protein TRP8649_03856 [Pelagimonas phthalicica]|uniref:Uncharacterized protein n=1 Tax=Pelagimonas phthalicica TaxID=1037362 RepID=A0A238JHU5_9RHOB|nr:hypothetical protein [Pelagimonas phthalicica]TDS89108.1 hypothetical protein CLV87_4297 [Pelagimonas phthalicica]SMX29717.1 hypothetical protein TRP8649_03856 [Pelagimonas phthalicica]
MQRLGALAMSLACLLSVVVISGVIFQQWNVPWTARGVAALVFGLTVGLLLVPLALLHGLSAFYPSLLRRYKSTSRSNPDFLDFKAIQLQWAYGVLGYFVCAGLVGLVALWAVVPISR